MAVTGRCTRPCVEMAIVVMAGFAKGSPVMVGYVVKFDTPYSVNRRPEQTFIT